MSDFEKKFEVSDETVGFADHMKNENINIDEREDQIDRERDAFTGDTAILINHFDAEKDIEEAELYADLTEEERKAFEQINAVSQENPEAYREIFKETEKFSDSLTRKFDFFSPMLAMIQNSDCSLELKKSYLLKAIDETWVSFIEEHLPALDMRVRIPSRFIEQEEKVMPIELSRNITSRSIQHLSQHTNFISKVEGDEITPSKILNVFNEETMMTYENKFVNTLVNRLFYFVSKRYEEAKKKGRDEKITKLNFDGNFSYGKINGKMHFGLEVSEEPEANLNLKNCNFTTDVWRRVEKLYEVVSGYTNSEFIKAMGRAYIRPPVMRTNAILKNKDLKQCLELWEFIESYEDAGYNMLAQEDVETVSEEYVKELYDAFTLQYLIFRYQIKNDFSFDKSLAEAMTDSPITPKYISEIEEFTADDYNIFDSRYEKVVTEAEFIRSRQTSDSEAEIAHAIDIALAADMIYDKRRLEEEERLRREAEEAARIAAEKAAREAEELANRLIEEEKARKRAEEEKKRAAEEAALAEQRRIEEEKRLAEERMAAQLAEIERKRQEREAEKNARIQKLEEDIRANEWKYQPEGNVSRKKKKAIRRAAEEKAERNGDVLPKVFDYDIFMQYLYAEQLEAREERIRVKLKEQSAAVLAEYETLEFDHNTDMPENTPDTTTGDEAGELSETAIEEIIKEAREAE